MPAWIGGRASQHPAAGSSGPGTVSARRTNLSAGVHGCTQAPCGSPTALRTRPFRPDGPLLEVEQVGDPPVADDDRHGGRGWSLSWGSHAIAVERAMAAGPRDVAAVDAARACLTPGIDWQQARAIAPHLTIGAADSNPQSPSQLRGDASHRLRARGRR